MARYYTPRQRADIQSWLCELQDIIPDQYPAKRDRAHELVALLKAHPTHWASEFNHEFERLLNVFRRLERQAHTHSLIAYEYDRVRRI